MFVLDESEICGYPRRMLAETAEKLLAGKDLVVSSEGSVVRIRELIARCLDADIPALMGPCSGSS